MGDMDGRRRGEPEETQALPTGRSAWDDDDAILPPRRPRQRIGGQAPGAEQTQRLPVSPPPPSQPPRATARPLPPRLSLPPDDDGDRYATTPAGPAHPEPGSWGPAGPGGPGPTATRRDRGPRPPRRRRRGRTLLVTLLVLLLLVGGYAAWMWSAVSTVWDSAQKVDATPAAAERPAAGKGKNYLVVGSDARAQGSSDAGAVSGARTDTIMLLHVSENDQPTLVSLPRDSYVTVPGNPVAREGRHKINAAYAWGGPKLLVATVERASGLRVDGFLEIGFSGFQSAIDSVDGLEVCVAHDLYLNQKVGTAKKGCQHMDGEKALAYVRARKDDPLGDIGRAQRQRQVTGLLMKKLATPGNLLLPWRVEKVGTPIARSITVSDTMSKKDALDLFLALRDISGGKGTSTVVPVANLNLSTGDGSAVAWDEEKARALWTALREDRAVSAEVLPKVPGQ